MGKNGQSGEDKPQASREGRKTYPSQGKTCFDRKKGLTKVMSRPAVKGDLAQEGKRIGGNRPLKKREKQEGHRENRTAAFWKEKR